MPKSLEPGALFPIVLDCDKDKDPCPTFWAKTQSMRGQQKIIDATSLEDKHDWTSQQIFEHTCQLLKESVAKWTGMIDADGKEIEYDSSAFDSILSFNEARELLSKIAYNQHMTFEEKKSSE